MALSCFLLLRILRVAVSRNSGLQLLQVLCWNAINSWGFRKTHHFCHHCSREWTLCTFWTIVQCRHIFHFIISAIYSERISPAPWFLQCWHALVSRFPWLSSLHTGVSSPPSVPPPPPLAPASDLSQLPCHTPVTLPLFSLYYTFPSQQKPQLHVTPLMLFYKTWE